MNGFNGEFLRGPLDVAPDGVVICEAKGDRHVVYANPAFCRLTGYEVTDHPELALAKLQGRLVASPAPRLLAGLGVHPERQPESRRAENARKVRRSVARH